MLNSPMKKACVFACLLAPLHPLLAQAVTAPEGSPVVATTPTQLLKESRLDNSALDKAVDEARGLALKGDASAQFALGLFMDIGAGARIDHIAAFKWLQRSADQGNRLAAGMLAWKCATGFGFQAANETQAAEWAKKAGTLDKVPEGLELWIDLQDGRLTPNLQRALFWMMDRADDGAGLAMCNLSEAYMSSAWTESNPTQHLFWLRKAAEAGDAKALYRLSVYNENGMMVEKNPDQAAELRRKAAEAGDPEAEAALGREAESRQPKPDYVEAVRLYRLAAEQDNTVALDRLTAILREGAPGVPAAPADAFAFATKAAQLDDPEATFNLGTMHFYGISVPQNQDKAFGYFKTAAEMGHVGAMVAVGQIYASPNFPGKDLKAAHNWFEVAARAGNPLAMRSLGSMSLEGLGEEKNEKAAFEWFERAGRNGDPVSQMKLGYMLQRGVGIERDPEEAVTWFKLAAEQGEPVAQSNLGFHYMTGEGIPYDAEKSFICLCRSLAVLPDDWASGNLASLCSTTVPESRAILGRKLCEVASSPDLVKCEGLLPEALTEAFSALGNRSAEEDKVFQDLLARLSEAHRPGSLCLLSFNHLIGLGLPYDLAKARALATEAKTANPEGSEALLALADLFAADSDAARDAAFAQLLALGEKGNRHAGMLYALIRVNSNNPRTEEVERLRKAARMETRPTRTMLDLNDYPLAPAATPVPAKEVLDAEIAKRAAAGPNTPPSPIHSPAPEFPMLMRQLQLGGEAQVQVLLGTDGLPKSVKVTKATHPLFGIAAAQAVSAWRFAPMRKNGVPVEIKVALPIVFNLQSDAPAASSNK
jgi:TonB family protein